MSLPKFVLGMIFVVATIAAWSYLETATIGVVLLRMVSCAIILQLGYFLIIFAMVAMSRCRIGGCYQEASVPDRVAATPSASNNLSEPVIASLFARPRKGSAEDWAVASRIKEGEPSSAIAETE